MKLPRVLILRDPSTDEGTPGVLVSESFGCRTLELPWLDNARKRSCIPAGVYRCAVVQSPRFGRVYGVQRVPGRTHILIHAGNWAGQIPQRRTHVQGCILLGERMGSLSGQRAVLLSRPAVRRFMAAMQGRPFELEVRWNH
jgi:hypothetical protein